MAKSAAKGKKGKAGRGLSEMSISAHPRARQGVRTLRSWGGLVAFLAVAILSYRAGVAPFEVGVRALVGGIAGFLFAWMAGVALWRQIIVAELRTEFNRRVAEREAVLEAAAEAVEAEEAMA